MSTVLVVDDEPSVRDVVVRYLEREGYGTLQAGDGDVGAWLLEQETPSLVVLDLMLPAWTAWRCVGGSGALRASGDHGHRARRRGRPADRARARRRRLPDQAVLPARADRPRQGCAAASPPAAPRPSGSSSATSSSTRPARGAQAWSAASADDARVRPALVPGQQSQPRLRARRADGQVWGYTSALDTGTVTVHMRRLRAKIEDDPSQPRHLETVWGSGLPVDAMIDLAILLALGTLVVGVLPPCCCGCCPRSGCSSPRSRCWR